MRPAYTNILGLLTLSALLTASGCDLIGPFHDRKPDRDRTILDLSLCDPDEQTFTLDIDNRYFPLPVGQQWSYEGEEDGVPVALRITVFDETEVVGGVTTRVVEEREWEDGELLEVSRNYYAQTTKGTVCYFGEAVDIFEDGEISHAGAWRADEPGHAPGIYMPKNPKLGMTFQQEAAPGIAEDVAEVVALGEPTEVPFGSFKKTLRTRDCNPIDGDCGTKVYARGVNLIIDGDLALTDIE